MTVSLALKPRPRGFLLPDPAKLQSMRHDTGQSSIVMFDQPLPATKHDWSREVGDGLKSSVLAAPLNFLLRTAPEAPLIVEKRRDGLWHEDEGHELAALLEQPNDFYSGRKLIQATVLDLSFGNAYWVKIRNMIGDVIQLWWVPRYMMRPKWPQGQDSSTFVSHYAYTVGGKEYPIAVRDVVHFRFGLDPHNHRYGLSPLGALVREIAVDDYAANFTASILKNLGVIGVVITPEAGVTNEENLRQTKAYVETQFTDDRRAKPLVLGAPTKVQLLQYNLQGFDVSPVRDVSEERVCAAIGIPAAVVGFGTGLHQTKVGATMREMMRLAWTGGIMPILEDVVDEVKRSLLPEFEANRRLAARVRADASQVRALQEENNERHQRVREDFKAKIIDLAEARRETGRTVKKEHEGVFFSGPSLEPGTPPTNPKAPPGADDEPDTDEDET